MPIIYKHRVSPNQLYLATAEFPRIKLKIRYCLQYCKSEENLFTLKFRKFFFTQNIPVVVCFEVSPRLFGYRVAHDSWQEIHHMSSKWNKMCQPQKKQKQHSNNTMISQN